MHGHWEHRTSFRGYVENSTHFLFLDQVLRRGYNNKGR